jgi:hypothetical protein
MDEGMAERERAAGGGVIPLHACNMVLLVRGRVQK